MRGTSNGPCRAQQILALETDLLEYDDIFEGSKVIEARTDEIATQAWAELERVQERGGSIDALGYMKERLVSAHAERRRAIESGDEVVVGLNRYTEGEPSPLVEGLDELAFEKIDPAMEAEQMGRLERWRVLRDAPDVTRTLDDLRTAASGEADLLPVSIAAAKAGVTTGEWADALRDAFGEYRAPTGDGRSAAARGGPRRWIEPGTRSPRQPPASE